MLAFNLYFYAVSFELQGGIVAPLSPCWLLLLIPLIMLSRVYFGAHWAADTIVGSAAGWAATVAVWSATEMIAGAGAGAHRFGTETNNNTIMNQLGFIGNNKPL